VLLAAATDFDAKALRIQGRRMACQAEIIPMILGGPSEVLDVGCKQRFHTEAMRMAMLVRDQGCATHGCERPGSWCHAHHLTHHPNGTITFHRRE
jgi:hypothetical protein